MILLDTDHLTVASYPADPRYAALSARMRSSGLEEFATTIVSVEEQMRGWLGVINKVRDLRQQAARYDRLIAMIKFFSHHPIRYDGRRRVRAPSQGQGAHRVAGLEDRVDRAVAGCAVTVGQPAGLPASAGPTR